MRNFSANLGALAELQPELIGIIRRPAEEWTWIYGRDGALTALSSDNQWLSDCSLPRRAAEEMLKNLNLSGRVSALLAPVHAWQIRRMLELMPPDQAVIVITPDASFLPMALHCVDFSEELFAHRLFFASGENYAQQLTSLFDQYPGLPTPSVFIRPPTTLEHIAQPLIESSTQIFTKSNASRSDRAPVHQPRADIQRVCVIAPSIFRLWQDAGTVLADVLASSPALDSVSFDPDRPTSASNLALATAMRDCDALVAANYARAHAPAKMLSPETPWITWITLPTLPDGSKSAPHDRIILADPTWAKLALDAGWTKEQISIAAWPAVQLPPPPADSIGLIADTLPIRTDIDSETFKYSSHMVLWELIANELPNNPLLAAENAEAYLDSRMTQLSISPEGFNRSFFIEHLIMPAVHQGLARWIMSAKLPLKLFGNGWDLLPEFSAHSSGPVESRQSLLHAAASVQRLISPALDNTLHPIDAFRRPLIRPTKGTKETFLRTLSNPPPPHPTRPILTPDLLQSLLHPKI
jgi:hypothetical protein